MYTQSAFWTVKKFEGTSIQVFTLSNYVKQEFGGCQHHKGDRIHITQNDSLCTMTTTVCSM